MKLEFTDSELEEFKHLLKWAISEKGWFADDNKRRSIKIWTFISENVPGSTIS